MYPQRSLEIGSIIARNAMGGGTHHGRVQTKVILVANLLDNDAFPWHADWYSNKVKKELGKRYDDNFRLWYNDNADHIDNAPRTIRLVQYNGILQQALRDMALWVEDGVAPMKSTQYNVRDGQIQLPEAASNRLGIQPTIQLKVNGKERIEVDTNQTISFDAYMEVPPGAGEIVSVEWDFLGNGEFKKTILEKSMPSGKISTKYKYDSQGTYYPIVRVTAQRDGDKSTQFTKVENLDRMRVIVNDPLKKNGTVIDHAYGNVNGDRGRLALFKDQKTIPNWAVDSISELVNRDMISGRPGNLLDPLGNVTIMEYLKLLVNVMDYRQVDNESLRDISVEDISTKAIYYGIINETDKDKFAANNPLLRQDMTKLTYNTLKVLGTQFPKESGMLFSDDENIDSNLKEALYNLKSVSIVNGNIEGSFEPLKPATRTEAFVIIERILNSMERGKF